MRLRTALEEMVHVLSQLAGILTGSASSTTPDFLAPLLGSLQLFIKCKIGSLDEKEEK